MEAPSPVEVVPGCLWWPGWFDRPAQEALVVALRQILTEAPLFVPRMPRTGKPFSVRMSNCGSLGWVSDETGYRYQPFHPESGRPWPAMPATLTALWAQLAPDAPPPEACLINWYDPAARMGLHQDRDEEEFGAPVVSVSLGDTGVFRIGGTARTAATRSIRLASGDVLMLSGPSRLAFHGIDRIVADSSLLKQGGRINLTLRRVRPA
ncbi:alpha-ketoglutarate-dependent dioxygenase AlkB [Ancylobacter sp. 6x-1]|uniref:Alpha-ketoglutarate-dependent dioxygenase AlkB n=1 Tax=Ancylobacter crimeensis TaxID=2579147 RepID=A0ABT0DC02_9HYPH|nr:alpha-ketoglutarate-dependent dioxygenase AlkB [Ancylobacter crimeensis]MCK0197474.1 alpha-ketoglutarate-dependent dioxygenase AlkB [Ancylobacter crimeensis]